jgi:hypothetical protein
LCSVCLQGARNEIFAMQPAPVQVSYMGFPGTTGADYIHYLVSDEVLSGARIIVILFLFDLFKKFILQYIQLNNKCFIAFF